MKISFYATLRQIVGTKTIEISLPRGATVQQVVAEVVARYPDMRQMLLDEQGELHPYVHVFINGRDAPYLEHALETSLQPDDCVDIFPAVGGGQGT